MKRLGIKRETKNIWERRVPLNPEAVKELIGKGFEVIVQPSAKRIYKDEEYKAAGAILSHDLSTCDFLIGVKEIYGNHLHPNKPHLYFSHVIKGQSYNMPMLKQVLRDKITLLDYEKITDAQNRRLVFFGKFAGIAGMIDTLHGLGQRLQQQMGIATPFTQIKSAYQYDSVEAALAHISEVGKEIAVKGLPSELCPFRIFLMGYGNVSQGSRLVLNALPIVEIAPEDLAKKQSEMDNVHIYLSTFKEKDMVKRKDGSAFVLKDYYRNPQLYQSRMEEYLPYASVYVNAIYWAPNCPVFLPRQLLQKMQKENYKLIIIGDITCDIRGSVAATIKPTWPDHPVFIYDAETDRETDGFQGKGFAVMAVDNLPCEFPKEASDNFSHALMPFMEMMLLNDYSKPIAESDLPAEIKKACIAHQGKLQADYLYLAEYLK